MHAQPNWDSCHSFSCLADLHRSQRQSPPRHEINRSHRQRRRRTLQSANHHGLALAIFPFVLCLRITPCRSTSTICPAGFTGYQSTHGCKGYIYCVDGEVRGGAACSEGELFDGRELLSCVPSSLVNCAPNAESKLRLRSRHRDLANFPFLPSWADGTCKNDKAAKPWESGVNTLEECCRASFGWNYDSCVDLGSDTVNDFIPDDTPPKTWYFPVWLSEECAIDEGNAPSYMRNDPSAHMSPTFKKCCERYFSQNLRSCLDASEGSAPPPASPPVASPPTASPPTLEGSSSLSGYYFPIYAKYECALNGDGAPDFMKDDPLTYFSLSARECCSNHFPDAKQDCIKSSSEVIPLPGGPITEPREYYRSYFAPDYGLVGCVSAADAPDYMLQSPESYLFETIADCCLENFRANRQSCLSKSKELNGLADSDASTPHSVQAAIGDPSRPTMLVSFAGRLYFKNVSIPSKNPASMATIRDVVVNAIRFSFLRTYPLVDIEAFTFDGISLNNMNFERNLSQRHGLPQFEKNQEMNEGGELRGSNEYTENHNQRQVPEYQKTPAVDSSTSPRKLSRLQIFTFGAVIPLLCDRVCAGGVYNAGRRASQSIIKIFDEAISNGALFQFIIEDMENMGLIGPFYSASLDEGHFSFQAAQADLTKATWSPTIGDTRPPTISPTLFPTTSPTTPPTISPTTYSPTYSPTLHPSTYEPTEHPTNRPTNSPTNKPLQFYPDYNTGTCYADGLHSEFALDFYDTLEMCCQHPWLKKNLCMILGTVETESPTSAPTTPMPTKFPTSIPTHFPTTTPTKPPSSKPTLAPTAPPTYNPTKKSTENPTQKPTGKPTGKPTRKPSRTPTKSPVIVADPTPAPTKVVESNPNKSSLDPIIEDFENGLSNVFQWSTGPALAWTIDDTTSFSGSRSLKSTSVKTPGQSSRFTISLDSVNGGTLLYQMRTDVFMPWNGLHVKYDGENVAGVTGHEGEPSFKPFSVAVEKGKHEVQWEVWSPNADVPNRRGEGAAWIDSLQFYPELSLNFESKSFDLSYTHFAGTGTWGIDDSQPSSNDGLAAHSPKSIAPGEHSTMVIKTPVPPGGATLSFDFFLGMGSFSFSVNGLERFQAAVPASEAKTFGTILFPGISTLTWRYNAPEFPNLPLSMVWIDNVKLILDSPIS